MKKQLQNSLRLLLVVTLCTGGALALAFTGPTATPPGDNVTGPINNSSLPQKKGLGSIPGGSLLHIEGTTSANRFFAWNNATINNDLTIDSLREPGWTTGLRPVCISNTSKLIICAPSCGNTFVESGEQCDDGNTTNGDGCSNTCQSEGPLVCGNNILESGEQCDDGNTTNGDGCSNTCQDEPFPLPPGIYVNNISSGFSVDDLGYFTFSGTGYPYIITSGTLPVISNSALAGTGSSTSPLDISILETSPGFAPLIKVFLNGSLIQQIYSTGIQSISPLVWTSTDRLDIVATDTPNLSGICWEYPGQSVSCTGIGQSCVSNPSRAGYELCQ